MLKQYLQHRLRSGRKFKRYLKDVVAREKYTFEQLAEYRKRALKQTINVAYKNVPFYREIFKERGLTPDDIESEKDLEKLPIIDKSFVREDFSQFRNQSYQGIVVKGHTSGSSGTPGVFLRDLASINCEKSALWRQYIWAGKPFGSKRVTLRGERVCSISRKEPPFWKYNRFSKELLVSSYHMSDENMHCYVNEIKRFEAFDLYAYPSTAYLLANFCKRFEIDLKFSCVFTSAEVLHDYQRQEIESVFGCKVFDQYGSAERVVNILQCEHGTYHEMSDYSIVEYLPVGDQKYAVVGTSLFNSVMPLIRYRLGDMVELEDLNDCPCGRRFRNIKSIIGRSDDFLILRDGRRLGRVDRVFKTIDFLKEAQIIQHDYDDIEVKIVPSGRMLPSNSKLLIDRLYQHIGYDIRFRLNEVDFIDRGANGKFNLVRNMMDKETLS